MIDELKVYLGETADNFTDAQIGLALKFALAEIEAYTKRTLDYELEVAALQIAKIKLLRLDTEVYCALQPLNHGITLNDAYDIFDAYLADGNGATDFITVILDIYKVSGLIRNEVKEETEKN